MPRCRRFLTSAANTLRYPQISLIRCALAVPRCVANAANSVVTAFPMAQRPSQIPAKAELGVHASRLSFSVRRDRAVDVGPGLRARRGGAAARRARGICQHAVAGARPRRRCSRQQTGQPRRRSRCCASTRHQRPSRSRRGCAAGHRVPAATGTVRAGSTPVSQDAEPRCDAQPKTRRHRHGCDRESRDRASRRTRHRSKPEIAAAKSDADGSAPEIHRRRKPRRAAAAQPPGAERAAPAERAATATSDPVEVAPPKPPHRRRQATAANQPQRQRAQRPRPRLNAAGRARTAAPPRQHRDASTDDRHAGRSTRRHRTAPPAKAPLPKPDKSADQEARRRDGRAHRRRMAARARAGATGAATAADPFGQPTAPP